MCLGGVLVLGFRGGFFVLCGVKKAKCGYLERLSGVLDTKKLYFVFERVKADVRSMSREAFFDESSDLGK